MPGLAECDSSWSGRWVVRHQTAMGLYVADLWRCPAKTLAAERLSTATAGFTGIFGDRAIWVVGPKGGPDVAAALIACWACVAC